MFVFLLPRSRSTCELSGQPPEAVPHGGRECIQVQSSHDDYCTGAERPTRSCMFVRIGTSLCLRECSRICAERGEGMRRISGLVPDRAVPETFGTPWLRCTERAYPFESGALCGQGFSCVFFSTNLRVARAKDFARRNVSDLPESGCSPRKRCTAGIAGFLGYF